MENENVTVMSPEYSKAVEIDTRIKTHAVLAQQSLYEVCKGLKEMRDGKLYKELNYQNFEDYCETEIGLKRRQAYKFISVAENLSMDFVYSSAQIGITKLALLAQLDEPQREEIVQSVDLESTSVKELKAKISALETENKRKDDEMRIVETNYRNLEERYKESDKKSVQDKLSMKKEIEKLETQSQELESKLQEKQEEFDDFRAGAKRRQDMLMEKTKILTEQVKTLETRPVEVAVQENTDEIDRLTFENEALKKQLSEKPMIQETFSDGNSFSEMQAEFRAYLKTLDDAMNHLCAFIARNEKEYDMWRYISKITEKIDVYIKVMREEKEKCQ